MMSRRMGSSCGGITLTSPLLVLIYKLRRSEHTTLNVLISNNTYYSLANEFISFIVTYRDYSQ